MRLLVADSDRNRLRQTAHRLATLAGITVTDLCADLTQTFNAVEHRPPNLALVDPALARRPEFEMMEVLFRTLSVRWIPLAEGGATAGLDLQQDDAAVLAALRRGLQGGGLAAPRAGAGLLQSVDPAGTDRLILIGSSTGGVDALLRVLGSFPIDCPPTLIVQHTGAAYSAGLARLLDRQVTPRVREAEDGAPLGIGTILLAPGAERHLVIHGTRSLSCRLVEGPRVSGHRPSVDVLFQSATPVASRVTAAILTGMGRDGAEGLLALRRAGARTIGQDRATSVVYGMPGAAAELGAVASVLPLATIGPALLRAPQGVRA